MKTTLKIGDIGLDNWYVGDKLQKMYFVVLRNIKTFRKQQQPLFIADILRSDGLLIKGCNLWGDDVKWIASDDE